MDILGFWDSLPPDVRNFVVNLSSNLALKFYPDEKDKIFRNAFSKAYTQGLQYFAEALGTKNIPNIKPLFENVDIEMYFIEKIKGCVKPGDPEKFRKIVYENKIPLGDYQTLDQIDLKNASLRFLKGYHKKADELEPLLRQSIKYRLDETVDYLKKILDQLTPLQSNLESMKEKYITFLKEKYSVLSFKGFCEKELSPIPLNEIYTFLRFREHGAKIEKDSEEKHPGLREKKIEVDDILAVPYAVVTGNPGCGKSTLLKYITFQMVNDHKCLPIFFPISAYADACKDNQCVGYCLREFIPDYFKSKNLPDLTPLFKDAWEKGRAIFLIDGLDEVANETERKKMVDHIQNLIITDNTSENQYIVTCRTESYKTMTRFDPVKGRPFVRYDVEPFDIDQIRHFFHRWYCWYEKEVMKCETTYEENAKKSTEKIVSDIKADKNILDIATNPLMLTVLALIEHEGAELPKNRADLYRQCLSMLSVQWEKLRSSHEKEREAFRLGRLKINESTIVELIGPVAWKMFETGALQIESKELGASEKKFCPKMCF